MLWAVTRENRVALILSGTFDGSCTAGDGCCAGRTCSLVWWWHEEGAVGGLIPGRGFAVSMICLIDMVDVGLVLWSKCRDR